MYGDGSSATDDCLQMLHACQVGRHVSLVFSALQGAWPLLVTVSFVFIENGQLHKLDVLLQYI
jgi:hypothetical protein